MSKITQLIGDLLSAANAYTGVDRELRVETTSYNLRLHDGSTLGGHEFLNRDNADARYQLQNSEVDGIGPFLATDRGVLTRLGISDYRLRSMTASSSLTITNPDGFAGNPFFDIATTIHGDKTFSDNVNINGGLTVTLGINADTSGHHFGPVTGDVTGNLTGNVNGTTGVFSSTVNGSSFLASTGLTWQTGGLNRWTFNKSGTETGANAGGDLFLSSRADDGTLLSTLLAITRSNGNTAFYGPLFSNNVFHAIAGVIGDITGNVTGSLSGGDVNCNNFTCNTSAAISNGVTITANSGTGIIAQLRAKSGTTTSTLNFTNFGGGTSWATLTVDNTGTVSLSGALSAVGNIAAPTAVFSNRVIAVHDTVTGFAYRIGADGAGNGTIQFTNPAQNIQWAAINATAAGLTIATASLTCAAGFIGPLTGNTTGTHTGPVTGNVTGNASGSSGSCTGNAATASKWQTARNLTFTGAVTGTGVVDGSGDVSIATTYSNTVFTSAAVTISANSHTLIAHGAGSRPSTAELWARCTLATGIYSLGEDIKVPGWSWDDPGVPGRNYGADVSIVDATNCQISQGGQIAVNNGSGAPLVLTAVNWELRVKSRL